MTDVSRRRMLAALGGVGSTAASGCLSGDWLPADPNADASSGTPPTTDDGTDGGATPVPSSAREDFVWAERPLWTTPEIRRNLFAFAGRHGLGAVLAQADPTGGGAGDPLDRALAAATDAGTVPWLNTGVLKGITPTEFLDDPEARERHLSALRDVTARYRDRAPEGRIVLWQEAPVAGDWVEDAKWNAEAAENVGRYGPAVFERQLAAVREVAPDVDVGIFVHFPYVMGSRSPEVFADLMADIADRGATPEFVFTDFYRGWYEKDIGAEATDEAVRSLIRSARRNSGGLPVYHLMQAHTINPNHTPSKQSMRMDRRAAVGAGADGVGWYARTSYHETRRGFAPFVPNDAPEGEIAGSATADTFTIARDRYCYAWMATLADRADVDTDARFDLWIHCRDAGFHDHRLEVRTPEGWTFVGDVGGYVSESSHAPADGEDHVTVFRALPAERFATGGTVEARLATPSGSDGGRLRAIHALPFSLAGFLTEREATAVAVGAAEGEDRAGGPLSAYALGSASADAALDPGGSVAVSVPVDERAADPVGLAHPAYGDRIDRLGAVETDGSFDPGAVFDLWADGVGDPDAVADALPGESGATAAATAAGDVAVLYGLDRDPVLGDDPDAALAALADRIGGVRSLHAMPYFGRANFLSPERAAELLAGTPGEVTTYSVAAYRP